MTFDNISEVKIYFIITIFTHATTNRWGCLFYYL